MKNAIASTAPQRTAPVTRRQFQAMKGRLTLDFNNAAESLRAWNEFVPMTPAAAYKVLARELPADTRVLFTRLEEGGEGTLSIQNGERGGADKVTFHNNRSFDLGAGVVDAGSVAVEKGRRENGIGRRTMRNQIEFFHACGVRRFVILASGNNGGYTWARMGFLPREIDREFRYDIRQGVRWHMDLLRPLLDDDVAARIGKALRLRSGTDLWALADMDVDMVPLLGRVLRNPDAQSELTTEQYHHYADVFNEAAAAGRPLPLGRLLLTGTTWDGVLDMNNARQMRRVGAYCGGWKYIAVPPEKQRGRNPAPR